MQFTAGITVPSGWQEVGPLPPGQVVQLHLALQYEGDTMAWLKKELAAISYPSSARYGQFLSREEIKARVQPPAHRVQAVRAWAEEHHALSSEFNFYGDYMSVNMEASRVSQAFQCDLLLFANAATSQRHFSCTEGHVVPSGLSPYVDAVFGVSEPFPNVRRLRRSISGKAPPSPLGDDAKAPCLYTAADPPCLKMHYNISGEGSSSNNSQAVVEFAGNFFEPGDLAKFQLHYGLPQQPVAAVEGKNGSPAGAEASLDVQYIMAMAPKVPTTVINIDSASQTPFLDWAIGQNGKQSTPWVQSVSWGTKEHEYPAVDRLNAELIKFGLRGVTILFSSGDNGAGCVHATEFEPNYPASSPYVTAVGGTWIPPITTTYRIEGDVISGGGFSNTAANNRSNAPFQNAAVAEYQASKACPSPSRFTAAGRGLPDVSAFDAYYPIIQGGSTQMVDGTSAAAPVWAGIVSLLNDERLKARKAPMGFLSPWLYANAAALTDIVTGENKSGGCLLSGYKATKGWDPVTGLGTPIFEALKQAAMKA